MHKCVACQHYDRNEAEAEEKGVRWGQCRRTGPIVNPLSAKTYMELPLHAAIASEHFGTDPSAPAFAPAVRTLGVARALPGDDDHVACVMPPDRATRAAS